MMNGKSVLPLCSFFPTSCLSCQTSVKKTKWMSAMAISTWNAPRRPNMLLSTHQTLVMLVKQERMQMQLSMQSMRKIGGLSELKRKGENIEMPREKQ